MKLKNKNKINQFIGLNCGIFNVIFFNKIKKKIKYKKFLLN